MTSESIETIEQFSDLTAVEYFGLVEAVNENYLFDFRQELADFQSPGDFCIITTGSDGKKERHIQSKTEFIILQNAEYSGDLGQEFTAWYEARSGSSVADVFDVHSKTGVPEVKRLGQDTLSYAEGNADLVYPDRILNSTFVMGNPELQNQARASVLAEMTDVSDDGRRTRDRIRAQMRQYLRCLEIGYYYKSVVFQVDQPAQYYDERKETYTLGFKVPGIRTVQRALDVITIKSLQHQLISPEEALMLPANTVGRLNGLADAGILRDISGVTKGYEWFLQQYHLAQETFKASQVGVSVPFGLPTFLQHKAAVLQFVESAKG